MNRKDFLKLSGASLFGALAARGSAAAEKQPETKTRQCYELRRYEIEGGDRGKRLDGYLESVLLPAYNQAGSGPIGAFVPFYGQDNRTLYLLIPYPSYAAFLDIQETIPAIEKKSQETIGYTLSIGDPLYGNASNSLLREFPGIPKLGVPETTRTKRGRIFEMRTYQSASAEACKKKIEMFGDGGEIAIFQRTGMRPVFFGETVVGANLPSLTYLLAFDDIVDLDKTWKRFWFNSEWEALRGRPEYKDLIARRMSIILRPKGYSQI